MKLRIPLILTLAALSGCAMPVRYVPTASLHTAPQRLSPGARAMCDNSITVWMDQTKKLDRLSLACLESKQLSSRACREAEHQAGIANQYGGDIRLALSCVGAEEFGDHSPLDVMDALDQQRRVIKQMEASMMLR